MTDQQLNPPYERLAVETREQWRSWLAKNHDRSPGVWLLTWKKASGHPHLPVDALVDEALCFGWVDSRPGSLDADRSMRLVTPRRPASNWSRVSKGRVERLTKSGQMAPPGLAAVAVAKANGAWSALDEVEDLTEPDDLAHALGSNPDARRHWDSFPRSTRRAILEWIQNAKTVPTREKRIQRAVSDAAEGIRANQWRQPKR